DAVEIVGGGRSDRVEPRGETGELVVVVALDEKEIGSGPARGGGCRSAESARSHRDGPGKAIHRDDVAKSCTRARSAVRGVRLKDVVDFELNHRGRIRQGDHARADGD